MDNNKKWFDFMELANTIVKQGQKIDHYKPYIKLAFEPSFDNHFLLQLQLDKDNLFWYRTTWQKLIDTPKFHDPLQNMKYIGQVLKPTIQNENGFTDIKKAEQIIKLIKTISVRPRIEKWGGIILDGCFYTLTIGVESNETTYKWHYLPEEWTDLQKLANMLEELNKTL